MINTDTVLHSDSVFAQVKDTVFVPQYVFRNPKYVNSDTADNITCKEYIATFLKDSVSEPKERQSMFTQRTHTVHNIVMQENPSSVNNDWMFVIILAVLISTSFIIRFAYNHIITFVSGCFSHTSVNVLTKDGETTNPLALLPVCLTLLPMIAFLLYMLIDNYGLQPLVLQYASKTFNLQLTPLMLWFALYLSVTVVYFVRIFLIKIISWIFQAKKISNYYVQTNLNFGVLSGFVLVLPVLFSIYADSNTAQGFLFLSLLLIGILYVMQLFCCFCVIISKYKFSQLYLFFYLCTLELLPIIIVGKILLK
ncbi:MAG: DUF4271 domain-containing protein [Bacteroidales bacterium]|nr:DUF4271 domain-containing protein [Bacteroidales bacterium]